MSATVVSQPLRRHLDFDARAAYDLHPSTPQSLARSHLRRRQRRQGRCQTLNRVVDRNHHRLRDLLSVLSSSTTRQPKQPCQNLPYRHLSSLDLQLRPKRISLFHSMLQNSKLSCCSCRSFMKLRLKRRGSILPMRSVNSARGTPGYVKILRLSVRPRWRSNN